MIPLGQPDDRVVRDNPFGNTCLHQFCFPKENPNDFQQGDLVLKWDARHEDKGKHGKFEHLWKGPYEISENHGNNFYNL